MADRGPFFHAQQALIDCHAAKHRTHKELRNIGDEVASRHATGNADDDRMSPVSLARHRVSFSELLQYPEDGRRYELYDGELIELSAPILRHQLAILGAYDVLREYERAHGGLVVVSPMDVVFDEFNVLEPDVLFVVAERVRLLDVRQHVHVPPDLVVEVLSPSTARRDRGVKMRMYATYGVREYWIVDAEERQLQIHSLTDSGWVLAQNGVPGAEIASTILEGLRFDPARLFERSLL
jgi:Uma2 family endonuclease